MRTDPKGHFEEVFTKHYKGLDSTQCTLCFGSSPQSRSDAAGEDL